MTDLPKLNGPARALVLLLALALAAMLVISLTERFRNPHLTVQVRPAPQAPADAEPLQPVTTVTAPEALKGLTAVLADGQLSLKSNGQLLPAGAATDICPANCLPYLLGALAEGYLTEQGAETLEDVPCLRMALDTTGHSGAAVQCAVWLDQETLIPRYAEFSQDGQVVLTARMTAFSCTTATEE